MLCRSRHRCVGYIGFSRAAGSERPIGSFQNYKNAFSSGVWAAVNRAEKPREGHCSWRYMGDWSARYGHASKRNGGDLFSPSVDYPLRSSPDEWC